MKVVYEPGRFLARTACALGRCLQERRGPAVGAVVLLKRPHAQSSVGLTERIQYLPGSSRANEPALSLIGASLDE